MSKESNRLKRIAAKVDQIAKTLNCIDYAYALSDPLSSAGSDRRSIELLEFADMLEQLAEHVKNASFDLSKISEQQKAAEEASGVMQAVIQKVAARK